MIAVTLLVLAGAAARAQDTTITCPPVQTGEELRTIPEILPDKDGLLSTTFKVQEKQQCVPVNDNGTWTATPMTLRTYVYPNPKKPGEWSWGYPGPTLRLRKPGTAKKQGDRLWINLVNDLSPDGGHTCNSACPAGTVCPTDPSQLPDPATCGTTQDPLCCCWVDRNQKWPDCFHGDNTTNLHFHGTHVSPQPPQDYVLLELRPRLDEKAKAASDPAAVHGRGIVAYGEYHYKVDPLPPTQPEGTHWYHPHKHGSVALQVANGLPGALIIEGDFDDWLRGYYGGRLVEKLLVMQQVEQETNLYDPAAAAPSILVNGQVSPKITMRPGEVQRWRFVNATMKNAAQVSIYFPTGTTVRQIAMDGIQFAPENYGRQPLFSPDNPGVFKISPGNRADFLVQAPGEPGTHILKKEVFGNIAERVRERIRLRDEKLAPGPTEPPLVTLVVEEVKEEALKATAMATGFPTEAQWPKMPPYLRDIRPDEIKGPVDLTFQMSAGPGNPATVFTINGKQFDADCVDVTTVLDTALEWTVQNDNALQHPFHIHTNPFQVIRNDATTYQPPYLWQDTIALPKGTPQALKSVVLRHRYTEFTGEYVLHCHFLGHEDRGMMFAVQTVCPQDQKTFGKAVPFGKPECVPGNLIPAAPQCPAATAPAAASAPSAPSSR